MREGAGIIPILQMRKPRLGEVSNLPKVTPQVKKAKWRLEPRHFAPEAELTVQLSLLYYVCYVIVSTVINV